MPNVIKPVGKKTNESTILCYTRWEGGVQGDSFVTHKIIYFLLTCRMDINDKYLTGKRCNCSKMHNGINDKIPYLEVTA